MLANLLLPGPSGLQLDTITTTADTIALEVTATQAAPPCPGCAHPATHIHSRYQRTLADLPWAQVPVALHLNVRRFFCPNPVCPQITFAERIPEIVAPSARRTIRLAEEQRQIGFDLGGEAGSRASHRQGMPASPATLLRLVRRETPRPSATPRILGVDDWAKRKGQSYGTILVDLEAHCPVDLLPDRTADTFAAWLQEHPGVEVISRDRAEAYAEGASRGAPDAVQVADRFHLLQNLREALQRMLERHQASLRQAVMPPADPSPSTEPDLPVPLQEAASPAASTGAATPPAAAAAPVAPTRREHRQQERRERRVARYLEVRDLHAQGLSIRDIARQLHLSRQTVRQFIAADQFPERASHRKTRSKLDRYVPYLRKQLESGQDNGMQLWRELREEQGYTGSRALVSRWVAQHRHLCPAAPPTRPKRRGRPPAPTVKPPAPVRTLSARQAAWLLVKRPDKLDDDDRPILERLQTVCADVQLAYPLAQEFMTLVRERQAAAFDDWLARTDANGIGELQSFVAGLQRDKAAVVAALSLPYSNGQVEGQVNRLKLLKRSMYGRANFDLLRQRVLAA